VEEKRMSDEVARAHLRISGKVQGVFFRANTREQSQDRGVTGWVENKSDGTVEAVLEGAEEAVQEVVDWAETGPPRARVEDVQVDWDSSERTFDEFSIRR
jgi:acylphosphatase